MVCMVTNCSGDAESVARTTFCMSELTSFSYLHDHFYRDTYLLSIWLSCLHVCMCTMPMPGAPGSWEMSDSLELRIWSLPHRCWESNSGSQERATSALNHGAISPAPFNYHTVCGWEQECAPAMAGVYTTEDNSLVLSFCLLHGLWRLNLSHRASAASISFARASCWSLEVNSGWLC